MTEVREKPGGGVAAFDVQKGQAEVVLPQTGREEGQPAN